MLMYIPKNRKDYIKCFTTKGVNYRFLLLNPTVILNSGKRILLGNLGVGGLFVDVSWVGVSSLCIRVICDSTIANNPSVLNLVFEKTDLITGVGDFGKVSIVIDVDYVCTGYSLKSGVHNGIYLETFNFSCKVI